MKKKHLRLRLVTLKQLTVNEQSVVLAGTGAQPGSDDCCSKSQPSCPKTV
jgi:hypothetical protein